MASGTAAISLQPDPGPDCCGKSAGAIIAQNRLQSDTWPLGPLATPLGEDEAEAKYDRHADAESLVEADFHGVAALRTPVRKPSTEATKRFLGGNR